MTNSTIKKFGFPESLIGETDFWVVLLRPKQITAGCLVLACKQDATALGDISEAAGADLPNVCKKLENALNVSFGPEKINYVALMMVDPHVHFHVIPRYSTSVKISDASISDIGWPKHPNMTEVADLSDVQMAAILEKLQKSW